MQGLAVLSGTCSPHYNEREKDYKDAVLKLGIENAVGIENDCAIEYENGARSRVISAGGKAFLLKSENGQVLEEEI